MRRLGPLVLLALAGCGGGTVDPCGSVKGACIALTVESSQAVDMLTLTAFGQTRASTGHGAPPIHVALVPPAGTANGSYSIHVLGQRAGALVGAGDTSVTLAGAAHVRASVTLSTTGGGVDLGMSGDAGSGADAGGMSCSSGLMCPSGLCNMTTHQCATSMCDDGLKDGNETDVDCGGATCPDRCAPNRTCNADSDCVTGSCGSGVCQKASLAGWTAGPPLPAFFTTGTIVPGRADAAFISTGGIVYVISGWGQTSGTGQEKMVGHVQYIDLNAATPAWADGDTAGAFQGLNGNVGNDGQLWIADGGGALQANPHLFSHPANPVAGVAWTQAVNQDPFVQRQYFAAPVGPEGWIYIIGGGSMYTTAWDAVGFTYHNGPSLSVDRQGLNAALGADGKIYAMGGVLSGGGTPSSLNEQLDIALATTTSKKPMPTPKAYFGCVAAPDGRIYVIGGSANGNVSQGVTSVDAYTPATDTWSTVAALAHGQSSGGAVLVPDGHIWMIGGYSPDVNGGDISPYVEIYGPVVTLAKATAAAGETLSATGTKFAVNADVTVRAGGAVIGSGHSDGSGAAALTLTVPAGTPAGKLTLTVSDVHSQYPITVALTIQ